MKCTKKVKTLVTRDEANKEEGFADIVIITAVLAVIILCVVFTFKIRKAELTKAELEDGLTVSALAALVYDVDRMTASGDICINEKTTYKVFEEALKTNLNLNSDMRAKNPVYYESVKVKNYVVYNVVKNDIARIRYNPLNGSADKTVYEDGLGSVTAENGEVITCSSVYVELEVEILGFAGYPLTNVTVSNLLALAATEN